MSDPKRLGIDLGRLTDGREMDAPFVHPVCPGAKLYITRHDLESLVRGGEQFIQAETNIPPAGAGYGHARVRCGLPVQAELGAAGHAFYYGLCHSCSVSERNNRRDLRAAQKGAK